MIQNDGERFGFIFLLILRIFVLLQATLFLLKLDSLIGIQWKDAFWPFWIFFSVLIGLSFSVFLMLITKVVTFCIDRKDANERNGC